VGIELKYQPKQLEMRKAVMNHKITFVGGARGGGKSYFARNIAVEFALKYPGIIIAIFRKNYSELEANHIFPMMDQFPELTKYYSKKQYSYRIPVGDKFSTIRFCHCNHLKDLSKYQGAEFQLIIIDEAGEWTQEMITRLRASNRTSNPKLPIKLVLTGNPGGEGHAYLKRLFVDRKFIKPEVPDDYHFVPAFLQDNPALMEADPEYKSTLEQEPDENLRRAWLDGDWNQFAGRFFSQFQSNIHVVDDIDLNTEPVTKWRKFGSIDWGHFHPCAVLWFAQDMSTGDVYVYREYVTRLEPPDKVREKMFSYPDTKEFRWCVAGHDAWNRQKDGGPSIEEQFRTGENKLFLIRANLDRLQGWAQVRAYLNYDINEETGVREGPKLKICRSCVNLIAALPRMQHDKTKPEDMAEIQFRESMQIGDGEDTIDSLRYGLMSLSPFNKQVAAKQRKKSRYERLFRKGGRARSWQTT
jgi:phage terminase large subunit